MNTKISGNAPILLSAVVALALSGCAEKRSCRVDTAVSKAPIVAKAPVADSKDSQIAALKAAIAEAKNKTVVKEVQEKSSLYPPNAQAGKCYARVLTPAKFETTTKKVLAREESERLQVIPAKYQWVKKKVLIKEASERIVAVPATYKTIREKVLVSEASEKLVTIPAKYKTIREKILVSAAHTAWRKGRGPIEKLDNSTCEILCLVNVPAVYKTLTRRVLIEPATTKSLPIPAKYKVVTRKVIDQPASTKVVEVPAKYKVVKVKELVEPASVRRTTVPEEYRTIKEQVKVSDAILRWQEIACKSAHTRINIKSVQHALKDAGFNPGPIDGIMGWRTKSALQKFQKSNQLSTGALTQETLAALGL